MPYFFLIFLLVPLIEIYFLIEIGGEVGAGFTVLLVVLTAIIGTILVRAQGLTTFMRAQEQMQKGQTPAVEMLEGLMLFMAGALLLVPGFFTDAVGFLLLIPPLRQRLIKKFLHSKNTNTQFYYQQRSSRDERSGRVIDVDVDKDEDKT